MTWKKYLPVDVKREGFNDKRVGVNYKSDRILRKLSKKYVNQLGLNQPKHDKIHHFNHDPNTLV